LCNQGLIVAAGNRLGISGSQDLVATSARFINRQRGSGTRLTLARLLHERGIDRAEIKGYYTEEFTHLAVSQPSAAASHMLALASKPRRLKLKFIPLFVENYYLLDRRETSSAPALRRSWESSSNDFAALVQEIAGCGTSNTGELTNVAEVIG
jgi:molybdate-binding protein